MSTSSTFKSINPEDNTLFYSQESWSNLRLQEEISEAESDFSYWSKTPLNERISHLVNIKNRLIFERDNASLLMVKEMGKPISQAYSEIDKCINLCQFYIENSASVLSSKTIENTPFKFSKISFEPLGGILGVMPWNFPFWQVFRFILPALAAGNIVWLKHAPNVSLCNLLIEKIVNHNLSFKIYRATFLEIKDLPNLVMHSHIQGTSLTGSEQAGSSLAELSGKHIKKTLLELGGNDAFLINNYSNLKFAIHQAVRSRMINSGQTCISTKRLFVPNSLLEEVKNLLKIEFNTFQQASLLNPDTFIGLMARSDLALNLDDQIVKLEKLNFEKWFKVGEDSGNFRSPVVYFAKTNQLFDEELFGPVLLVYGFDSIDKVISLINSSRYGLGASVWSDDMLNALEIASSLQVGSVAINNIVQSNAVLPFGGIKKSGFGRELGVDSLLEFVNKKVIYS